MSTENKNIEGKPELSVDRLLKIIADIDHCVILAYISEGVQRIEWHYYNKTYSLWLIYVC